MRQLAGQVHPAAPVQSTAVEASLVVGSCAGQGCRTCCCMGRSRSSNSAGPAAASMKLAPRPAMRQPMGTLPRQIAPQHRTRPSTSPMQRPEALPVCLSTQAAAAWRLLSPFIHSLALALLELRARRGNSIAQSECLSKMVGTRMETPKSARGAGTVQLSPAIHTAYRGCRPGERGARQAAAPFSADGMERRSAGA